MTQLLFEKLQVVVKPSLIAAVAEMLVFAVIDVAPQEEPVVGGVAGRGTPLAGRAAM